jgi:DNA-binding response OmpR family regulator
MEKIRALLAEDEVALAAIIKETLETRNIEVVVAPDGKVALEKYYQAEFDILILDVMMPEKNGFELCKTIREGDKTTPIIMLTSMSQTQDVVEGFKSGANDYLKKPFSIEELIIRIEALVGRNLQSAHTPQFEIGMYTFDFAKQILDDGNHKQALTAMEAEILLMLIQNRNAVVDKATILKKIWGRDTFFNGRSLDVFITKLRKKLAKDPNVQILNSRGKGYKISV